MPKYYTDTKGIKHELIGKSTKRLADTLALDKEYAPAAAKMAQEYKTDIFYSIKQFDGIGNFMGAQYFAIPVEPGEISNIIDQFGESCYIGIEYCKDISPRPPIILKSQSFRSKESMSGGDFEKHCADVLERNGFTNVRVTPKTGDHGADILAYKSGELYVVQCKRYSGNVGFDAIKEAFTARELYHATHAVVMTNSHFTKQAIEDARKLGVKLFAEVKI